MKLVYLRAASGCVVRFWALAALVLAVACSTEVPLEEWPPFVPDPIDSGLSDVASADGVVGDAEADASADAGLDAATDAGSDVGTDSGTGTDSESDSADGDGTQSDAEADVPLIDPEPVFRPESTGLYASWSYRPFELPLGISTAGYGQLPGASQTFSPYVESFHSTRHQYAPPGVRALVLYRGDRRLLMVQTDLIAIREILVIEVLDRLLARTGVDMSDDLLLMANHTHAGPARWMFHPIAGIVADSFHQVILARVADNIADTIMDALGTGEPVRVGHGWAQNGDLHNDRRCENPEFKDDTMGLLKVEREADGSLMAVVMNYGVHGTAFSPEDRHLSGDVPGLIEQKVAESFDAPVHVMFVQSWAGDMSPGNPSGKYQVATSIELPDEYVRMEALGASAAETIHAALPGIATFPDLELDGHSERVPANYHAIGYTPGEFAFEGGGFYCGADNSICSNGVPPPMESCLPLPPEYAIPGLRMGAFRIGELVLFSLPGEPVTQYALDLMADVRADTGLQDLWPVGYALDHIGYLLSPEDWMMGGYEPSFTFLGPKQGVHAGKMAIQTIRAMLGLPYEIPFLEEVGPLPVPPDQGEDFVPEESVQPGTVAVDVDGAEITAVAHLEWRGGDPWVDHPYVVVEERLEDGSWVDLHKANGVPLDNRWYELAMHIQTIPEWHPDNYGVGPREFIYSIDLFGERPIPSTTGDLRDRVLRFRVEGAHWLGGEAVDYLLTSASFDFGGPVAPAE